jgi:DNA-binding NarL/FixJ family response regulator
MAQTKRTHIFCFDDHRNFSEDVKKRFSDTSRYRVESFQGRQELLNHLIEDKKYRLCKVAILGIHDTKEHIDLTDKLSVEIRRIDPSTGIILLIPVEKFEEIKKAIKVNIDAYIPHNSNSILRIHNIVKKLISENGIIRFRKRRNVSVYTLVVFIIASVLLLILASIELPNYF